MSLIGQMIVWIVIGLIGGGLASYLTTGARGGFGNMLNLGIGLLGAVVGGFLFRIFGLFDPLDRYAVSLRDVLAAVVGSLLVLALFWYWGRSKNLG